MKRCILILLLLGTLLWAVKPDPKAVVGKIDNETYTYSEYDKILNNYISYYEKQQGKTFTDEEKGQYNDRCWEELVGRYIYDKAIKAGKVRITNQELLNEAKKNPPAAVKQIKDLNKNGKFDRQQYEKALNENAEFRSAVLDEVRSLYQYGKLLDAIRAEVDADEDSVHNAWVRDQELIDAQIIFFDANKMTSVNASEEDARMYYEGHRESYRRENCRRYYYVKIPKAATAADSLAVQERVQKMYKDILDGADFAELAKANSQDPGSGKNGGDLGWFTRGRMVPQFEETAFKTPVGQLAEPVLSQFGWHIIQVTDRRTNESGQEEISARHILIKNDPSEATLQAFKANSATLHSLAKSIGLRAAADSLGYKVEESAIFQEKDSIIRGIGRDANLISFAFANPVGSLADIFYASAGDAFICEVSAVLPEYYIPFEDDKMNVTQAALRSKRGYYMNQYVQNFIKTLTPDQYLEYAAKDSIMVVDVKAHKKGDAITGIGKSDTLDPTLFAAPVGSFGPLISEQMRWFLPFVSNHTQPDPAVWAQDKKGLMQKARDDVRQKHLNDWYRAERQKINLIDNRRDFYTLSPGGKMQLLKP